MFDSLSEKLGGVFGKLRGKATLSENDVMAAAREIRIALLEADVALPVVKEFIETIKNKATGQDIIKGVNPSQQVVKIVNDALIEMLGSESSDLQLSSPPCAYLMVGLQGSGKTTTTAKIAKILKDKRGKKVLMASLDIYRPAAQEQLKQLGEQIDISTLEIIPDQKPVEIAKRALDSAKKEGYDIVILDTAGRLSIDDALMEEATQIKKLAHPIETLLVADAMTGQDAVNTAQAFDQVVGLSGIVLTRIDGDARGGAAMSMKAVTGKPIKLLGTGEKWDAIETFHPDRIASRILGMGDVVSLVEKAAETVDQEEAAKMAKKFKKGQFDFNDLLSQMQQMQKMGGMGAMMKMLPGIGNMAGKLEEAGMDESILKKQEAIIFSMTPQEREKPELLNASRKKRIAQGSGVSVQEINVLNKQLKQMQTVMKRMKKMGMGKMMGMMKDLTGGDMGALSGAMDPDALAADMQNAQDHGPLGPNPFDQGMNSPELGSGLMPGELERLLGTSGGGSKGPSATKKRKDRKKKKKR